MLLLIFSLLFSGTSDGEWVNGRYNNEAPDIRQGEPYPILTIERDPKNPNILTYKLNPWFWHDEPQRHNLVENQRIIFYFSSQNRKYNFVRSELGLFFTNWANSCPGDDPTGPKKLNHVHPILISPTDQSLAAIAQSISTIRPHSVIVHFTNKSRIFAKEYWSRFLDRISNQTGCIILSPLTANFSPHQNFQLKELQKLIAKKQHSCQILSVDEEMRGSGRCPSMFSGNSLSKCGMEVWIEQVKRKACNMDPRSFIDHDKWLNTHSREVW